MIPLRLVELGHLYHESFIEMMEMICLIHALALLGHLLTPVKCWVKRYLVNCAVCPCSVWFSKVHDVCLGAPPGAANWLPSTFESNFLSLSLTLKLFCFLSFIVHTVYFTPGHRINVYICSIVLDHNVTLWKCTFFAVACKQFILIFWTNTFSQFWQWWHRLLIAC